MVDPTGHFFDTIMDIGFAIYDTVQAIKNPSWENAGYAAWSIGSVFVPGSYVRYADDAVDGLKSTSSKRILQRLRDEEVIVLKGKARASHYRLNNE